MPRKKAPKARPPDAEPSPRPYVYEHQEESTPTTESTASSPHTLCASLADFSATFGQHLDANDQAFIPEPCHHTYRFHLTATFLVDLSRLPSLASTLPKKATLPSSTSSTSYTEIGANGSTPSQIKENAKEKEKNLYLLSTAGALNASDPDAERMAKQRAVARAIVDAVQAVDGYRYARSGGHVLKAERGSVMIFVCNDSVQNKDRLANARGLSQAQGAGRKGIGEGEGGGTGGGEGGADGGVEEEEEEGKGKKKRRGGSRLRPTYDCSGAVTVKFRSKSQVLEVEYRHLMVHRETAWRDQGPRVLTTEEVEAKKEKKRERRREERKREREKKEQERRESGTTSVTSKRKRKRGEVEAVDGIHAPFNANSESAEMYAEGNDSDTLAELLQADMHDMDQETATAVGPAMGQNGTVFATNGHLTGEMPNGSDGGKVLKKQRGGCLTCRRRKVKACAILGYVLMRRAERNCLLTQRKFSVIRLNQAV
ncbi:MAG: hypothetical protein M1822_007573 [Bathelium mastoideum]|nr:MAG: hypothetical protein M1822_007573 [Bathelium mastoideum]